MSGILNIHPIVSIGLPVYNGENFIVQAIDSILSQTFSDFELIISDNGSTDNTDSICRELAEKDSRINYLRSEENKGAAWNFNHVFKLSQGKYFKWATHDDVMDKNYLEKCIEILNSDSSIVLCYPKRIVINETGEEIEKVSDKLNLNEKSVSARYAHFLKTFRYTTKWAIPILGLFRKDILSQTRLLGKFPAADTIILCEAALRGTFFEIDKYLFYSRKHAGMSNKANKTAAQIASFYDPNNKWHVQLPRWKWLFENKKSIKLAAISKKEKFKCYFNLAKWGFFRFKSLLVDLFYGIKQYYWILKNRGNRKL